MFSQASVSHSVLEMGGGVLLNCSLVIPTKFRFFVEFLEGNSGAKV